MTLLPLQECFDDGHSLIASASPGGDVAPALKLQGSVRTGKRGNVVKRLLTWAGVIVSLACIAFFIVSMAPHWQAMSVAGWPMRTWLLLAVGLGLYVASYASATLAWQTSLLISGQRVGYAKLAQVLLLSQFAKYLPGNVGHHVGRVVLARRIGLPTDAIIISMAVDMMILLVGAITCSLPALGLVLSLLGEHGADHGYVLVAALVALAGTLLLATLVPALRRAVMQWGRWVTQLFQRGQLPLFGRAWLVHCFAFIFGGTTLYIICGALAGSFGVHWLPVVGVYAAAWLLGFVMPGAPAGLGIREVALLVGLAPLYGEPQAIAAAATLRVVTTSGDGIVFLFALMRWRTKLAGDA